MKFKFIIYGLIQFLTMCNPMVSHVKNSQIVSNENRARNDQDLDNDLIYPQGRYRLDFKVGDRFKLKEPMYLRHSVTGVIQLTETTMSFVPKLENYMTNPEAYAFQGDNAYQIIRLVPKGEIIELVAIKSSTQAGFIVYFAFKGQDDWFRCSTFRIRDKNRDGSLPDGTRIHPYTYEKKLFDKLPN
jgi:hypothetical protein